MKQPITPDRSRATLARTGRHASRWRLPVVLLLCSLVLLAIQARTVTVRSPISTDRFPSSYAGPQAGTMDIAHARALVSSNPQVLLEKDRFWSQVKWFEARGYGIRPSDVVADVGCGTGTLVFTLIREGIAFKHLYAVDCDPSSLDFLRFALAALKPPAADRIETVLSEPSDVKLPPASVDVMIVYNTSVGLARPGESGKEKEVYDVPLLSSLARAMRPGGLLHYVLYRTLEPGVRKAILPSFERSGFRVVSTTFVPQINQMYIVFTVPGGQSPAR